MANHGHSKSAKLRWARNIVKTFEPAFESSRNLYQPNGKEAFWVDRYRRAKAILLAYALTKDV